ncbi:MAG: GNAT family N-acetyltransferase [Clostridiales bacterium]|nr:GNAT family N-acetyltransferase [Clostridiales bacterium]
MVIKRATKIHMEGIDNLLSQVLMVHLNGRPDLFRANARKYTDPELEKILADPKRPIFVAVDEQEHVMGYAFCVYQQHVDDNILTDIRTLYIDDICVDENCRKSHVGSRLYEYVVAFARAEGFYNVTLNVWSCNPTAMKFYEACGLVPYKVGMEKIL